MLGYLLVFAGSITTIVGDYLAKRWSVAGGLEGFPAIALYAITGALFMSSLKFGELTIMNAVWSILVFVLTSCIGLFIFHERLSHMQWVALSLGFLSILLFLIDETWGAGASIR